MKVSEIDFFLNFEKKISPMANINTNINHCEVCIEIKDEVCMDIEDKCENCLLVDKINEKNNINNFSLSMIKNVNTDTYGSWGI